MVAAVHMGKAPPALPALRAEIGLSLVGAGWVVSLFNVTGGVLGLVAGTFGDRFGSRRVVVYGLVALAAGSLAGAFAHSPWLLLGGRFLEGLGFIAVATAAPGMIVAATRLGDLRLALGAWSTYMPAGSAAAMVLAPLLLVGLGWRGVWVAAALLALVWAVLLLCWMPPDRPHHERTDGASLLRNIVLTVTRAGPWVLALAFGCYTIQWVSLMVWLPTFLVEQRGLAIGSASVLTALVIAGNVPGNLLGGWLLHRHLARWKLIALSGVGMIVCLAAIFGTLLPDTLRYLACLAFSCVGGMLPAAVLSGAPVVAPSSAQIATTNGLLIQGSNAGQMIGPPALAWLVTLTADWQSGYWLLQGAAVAVVALAWVYRRVERRLLPATA
jgi:MFS family permease